MKKRSFLLQNIVLILMSVYSIMMSIVAINSNYYNAQKLLSLAAYIPLLLFVLVDITAFFEEKITFKWLFLLATLNLISVFCFTGAKITTFFSSPSLLSYLVNSVSIVCLYLLEKPAYFGNDTKANLRYICWSMPVLDLVINIFIICFG